MQSTPALASVRNDLIRFATRRPPGSGFAVLDREVFVTDPPELVALSHSGDGSIVDALVELLRDPDRAWAAVVMLAAITGHEAKLVESFAAEPGRWWTELGQSAHERWSRWVSAHWNQQQAGGDPNG